jgi:shikimate dehydrogenase
MISGRTNVYGIFGFPVEHTFSPAMHNAGFAKLGMDACYVPFAVDPGSLADAVRAIVPLGLQGLNVTVPHKEKVIPFLHELSEEARLIGAVNTIEVVKGRLIGHNTDGRGFLRSLTDDARFDPRGRRFLVLGAGGAARAIGFSLALAGAAGIALRDVDGEKAEALVGDIRSKTGVPATAVSDEAVMTFARAADCLVNATPLGLRKSDPLPVGKEQVQRGQLVCDLVYNPPETALLQAARARGARGLSGLGMLLYQGVIAFEIWTGKKAPVRVMKNALARQIASRRA